ncbi:hypothetical protein MKC54_05240 [[Clostridium] innocuum]|nr:hypothetical protein [[Clostridium] innocuum]MCR0576285.1 hypothetical protein [[Clostridium] innocuum]
MNEVISKLLDDVKNYLDITWADDATDKKICGMISRSMKYLNDLTGSALDYEVEDMPRELLFLRVMYDRAGALDDFRKNYLNELNGLVTRERVKRYDTEQQND